MQSREDIMPQVLSLFSGCGGLDKGFEDAGFNIVLAIDNNIHAVETYNRNMHSPAVCIDVETDSFLSVLRDIGKADILIGGFPCQGFSKSGPKQKDDPRNHLFHAMVKAAQQLNPSIIIAENVDGLQQNFGGSAVREIHAEFNGLGYKGVSKIIDFASFGLAQHRRRAIFIFTRDGDPEEAFPRPTHNVKTRNGEFKIDSVHPKFLEAPLLCGNTIAETISDLGIEEESALEHVCFKDYPKDYHLIMSHIGEGQKLCDVRKASTSVHSWQIPEYFGEVSHQEISVLEALSSNRRHKIYGDVPNGNPLTLQDLS
jgi:DNA (cytosine-5)-methyltransferase 1